jgi:hypothetical protein
MAADIQWTELKRCLENKLALARTSNDGNLDPIATARLRGRIEAYKEIIALPTTIESLEAQSRMGEPE